MFQSTNQGFIDSANTWTVKSGIKHDDMEFVTMFHYCCNRNLLENRRSHFVPVTVCFKWEQHLPRHTVAISGAPNASENNPPGDSFGQLQGSMKAQKQAMFGWKINHPQTIRPKILELPCVMGLDYFVVIS